jgi:hypothetical protein
MSLLAIRLSRTVDRGRTTPLPPMTREKLLVSLLFKRAIASRHGANAQEAMLRAQILWSLPTLIPGRDQDRT